MFTLLTKSNIFMDSSLRNYIRTSIYQSIQKYIKKDNNNNNKNIIENNIPVLNELDKTNMNNIENKENTDFINKPFNKPELFGILLFLSLPTFIHYLYSKK